MSPQNDDSKSLKSVLWQGHGENQAPETQSPQRPNNGVSQRDLEYAVILLLVELASCDDGFDEPELHAITNGLQRLFGTSPHDVRLLVGRARHTLNSFRSTTETANLLRMHLSSDQRNEVMAIVDNVIHADGKTDGFEMFHRHKFARLLGITGDPPPLMTHPKDTDLD